MGGIVTITRQGQLTIPRDVRKHFGVRGSTKALLRISGNGILVEPRKNFWALSGAFKGKVRLSDRQLRRARASFAKEWASRV